MDSGRVSARYANALLNWAIDNNCASNVYSEALRLISIIDGNPEVKSILANNTIPIDKKQQVLVHFAKEFTPLLSRFVQLLIKMQRIQSLKNSLLMYMKYYRHKNGIVLAEVACAHEPSEDLKKTIESFIAGQYDKSLELNFKVEPSLIGGFVFTIDNKQVDKSIKGDLKRVEKLLLGH
jgi:F-type H+-transporting ATPase subunit delta